MRMLLAAAVASVCLAQPGVPDRSAKVIVQYGQVSTWSQNGMRALFPGESVSPQQMIVTGPDGYARFQISDGSTFEVFANSKLQFREHAGNMTDLLNVIIGRVKVFVQHLNGVPNYNKVSSPTAIISVRGTVFDVLVEDEDGTTLVSVDEGLVTVKNQTAPGDLVYLQPGDSIRVYKNQSLQARQIDRTPIIRGIFRTLEEAMQQVLLQRGGTGGITPGGGGVSAPSGGVNGDKGKGGTAPTAPGAPGTTTTTPSAPSAPGPPK
jgi:ferric-dicitrate binding protein FerR (iron transport regulator)